MVTKESEGEQHKSIKKVSPETLVTLFNAYYISYYGCVFWNLSSSAVKDLDNLCVIMSYLSNDYDRLDTHVKEGCLRFKTMATRPFNEEADATARAVKELCMAARGMMGLVLMLSRPLLVRCGL